MPRKTIAVSIQKIKLIGLLTYTPVYSGMVLVAVGLFILLPIHSFTTAVYDNLLSIAPEWVWGLIFTAFAILALTVTLVYGIDHSTTKYACMTNAAVWAYLAWSFFLSVPQSIGVPIFVMMALGSATILIPPQVFNSSKGGG